MSEEHPKQTNRTSTGAWIFASVVVLVVAFFILVAIGNKNLQDQTDAKKAAQSAAAETLSKCLSDSVDQYNNDLKINSTNTTTDTDGSTIYHGNATQFKNIDDEKTQRDATCHQTYTESQ